MRYRHTDRPGFLPGFADFSMAGLFFLLYYRRARRCISSANSSRASENRKKANGGRICRSGPRLRCIGYIGPGPASGARTVFLRKRR